MNRPHFTTYLLLATLLISGCNASEPDEPMNTELREKLDGALYKFDIRVYPLGLLGPREGIKERLVVDRFYSRKQIRDEHAERISEVEAFAWLSPEAQQELLANVDDWTPYQRNQFFWDVLIEQSQSEDWTRPDESLGPTPSTVLAVWAIFLVTGILALDVVYLIKQHRDAGLAPAIEFVVGTCDYAFICGALTSCGLAILSLGQLLATAEGENAVVAIPAFLMPLALGMYLYKHWKHYRIRNARACVGAIVSFTLIAAYTLAAYLAGHWFATDYQWGYFESMETRWLAAILGFPLLIPSLFAACIAYCFQCSFQATLQYVCLGLLAFAFRTRTTN